MESLYHMLERRMLHFREVQQFRQAWLWGILIGSFALSDFAVYQQLERMTLMSLFLAIGVPSLLLLWFYLIKLVTEVYDDEVKVQFVWMWRAKHIPVGAIQRVEAVTYRPIRDYGGWGIRMGANGWAYNISGNRGVRLRFADGRDFLIGSQRAEELALAIEARRRNGC